MWFSAACFESLNKCLKILKDGLSPSKKVVFICLNESPLRVMKNAF